MHRLTRRELEAYDRGANILARGSGSATPFADAARDDTSLPCLIGVDEISGPVATVVKFGATGTVHDWGELCLEALDRLLADQGLGREALAAIAPVEINRSQVDRALYVCHRLGKPLLDADHVGGTAIPTLSLCRSVEAGAPLKVAYTVVDAGGAVPRATERGLLDYGQGLPRARELDLRLRALTGSGGVAAALFLTADMRLLHPGSISRTIALGAAITAADPVEALLRFCGGERLGSGRLERVEAHGGVGFTARTLHIGALTVGVLNEFLVVEREGRALAQVPELIAVVDGQGRGVLTAQVQRYLGQELHVLRLPLFEACSVALAAEWNPILATYLRLRVA